MTAEQFDIAIARDFSLYPGGRFPRHGEGNGEDFRNQHLVPALQTGKFVRVIFDDAFGYPASFLEEAFGGLVRSGWDLHDLKERLTLTASVPSDQVYVDEAWQYMEDEAERSSSGVH
ncbi:MAG: STAS-like domain-containing protein [Pseudomonadota bacterium]